MGNRKRKSDPIPQAMRESARWVSWRPVKRGDRVAKVPVQINGAVASSTDPSTWTRYGSVAFLARRGWVLGDGIGCIDLDKCLFGGVLEPWAREIVDKYRERAILIEVSPSGEGVHIFAPMERGAGRKIRDGRNIEIYPPDSGRYMCITGKALQV